MKRLIALSMVLGLIFGSVATAEAGKKKKPTKKTREVTATYAAPGAFYLNSNGQNIGGVEIATGAEDLFMTIDIQDVTGLPVSAGWGQDDNGDGQVEITFICDGIEEPISILPGVSVTVFILPGPCVEPPGPGFATTGDVVATFSNMP